MQTTSAGAFFCRGWTAPKAGNSAVQNEDAFRMRVDLPGECTARLLLALSDGTTEAIYSGQWARRLIEAAESEWPLLSQGDLRERLTRVRAAFVPWEPSSDVPWYVRNKYLMQGSQATLLVLSAVADETGSHRLHVCGVGDCCVLLFKEIGEVLAFPISESSSFGQQPGLVGTRPQPELEIAYGQAIWQPGDLLLGCTDAVAQWVLKCLEMGQAALLFRTLISLLEEDSSTKSPLIPSDLEKTEPGEAGTLGYFAKLVQAFWGNTEEAGEASPEQASDPVEPRFREALQSLRDPQSDLRMRNDDATLVLCTLHSGSSANQAQEARELLSRMQQAFNKPQISIGPMESTILDSVQVLLGPQEQGPIPSGAACQ